MSPMNHIEQIQEAFTGYLTQAFSISQEQAHTCTPLLNTDPQKAQFGDLSSNAALVIGRQFGKAPMAIAQQIVHEFKHPSLEKIDIAGIGFVNLFISCDAWRSITQELFSGNKRYFKPDTLKPKKKYSIEFVSANPTGPLHIGNGRGGIIGDVLGNTLSFIGHDVIKEYYVNDAGAQVKKLGFSLLIRCQQLMGIEATLPDDSYHGEYLIDIAKKCCAEYGKTVLEKEEAFFQEYAQDAVLAMIKQTLINFGITYSVWFSEKSLHTTLAIEQILQELRQKDLAYEQDGAWWFKATAFGDDKDRVIKKASGDWTYVGADMAYLKNKIDRGADHLIMVLGQDHHSFTIRLKAAHEALDLVKYPLNCILYQLVRIKEGENYARLSKRAGRIISLDDLLQAVGKDVVRFFFLNRKADAHLEFDLDLALKKTEENPVYYIQYAYVRIKSILARTQQEKELHLDGISTADITNTLTADDIALVKKVISFKELLKTIAEHHSVHVLSHYAIELATCFHQYYARYRIVDPQNEALSRSRLALLTIIKTTLEILFDIIGISKPEQM